MSGTVKDDHVEVVMWRRRVLLEAGYTLETANMIAEDTSIDLHRAAELVETGCPPDVAVEILS